MVYKDFIIKKKTLRRRKASTIQHKLRVLMKCYTVYDFSLDDDSQTYKFRKTHRINGLTMKDPKEYSGEFQIEDFNSSEVRLILSVG